MAVIMSLMTTIETPLVLVAQELKEEVSTTMSTNLAEEMVADIAKEQDVSNLNKLTYATVGAAVMFMAQKLFAYARALGEKMHPTKRCKEPCEIESLNLYPCPRKQACWYPQMHVTRLLFRKIRVGRSMPTL